MHLGRSVLTLVHTVLFEFSADANPKDVRAAVDRFVALKEQCVLPTTCEPYVLSLKAGKNNSPEGLEDGATHGFVLEFGSTEDRDYYVFDDPHHQAFKESIKELVTKSIIVDFIDGVY